MAVKKRGLGRGLDALLSGPSVSALEEQAVKIDQKELQHLPVELVQRGKYQPRRDMDPEALEELAHSIRNHGVMQPIVVRPIGDNRYEIIAGERRWRATQQAGLDTIPAMVREVPDEAAIAMALIENIQREDLNPVEEARAWFAKWADQGPASAGLLEGSLTYQAMLLEIEVFEDEEAARLAGAYRDIAAWLKDPRAALPSGAPPVLPELEAAVRP